MKYQGKDLVQFSQQIQYAIDHYTPHGFSTLQFDNVLLCGLGGSGIAGRIVKSIFSRQFPLPVEVISDYDLPLYVGPRTLAIMCSYSGNTEETLAMYEEARIKDASIIVIATGGKLGENALAHRYKFYKAESGFQPRMALGYSLTYLMLIFGEFLQHDMVPILTQAAESLQDAEKYKKEAQVIFDYIKAEYPKKIAVITDTLTSPVGLRFCQQIQENAKAEAFLHELPESNHNVIESYYGKLDSIFIFIRSDLNLRTTLRFEFLEQLLKNHGNTMSKLLIDKDDISSTLDTIYTLDWLSLMLADYKKENSAAIHNINALKDFLSTN